MSFIQQQLLVTGIGQLLGAVIRVRQYEAAEVLGHCVQMGVQHTHTTSLHLIWPGLQGVAGMGSSLGVIAVYTAARALKVHTGRSAPCKSKAAAHQDQRLP